MGPARVALMIALAVTPSAPNGWRVLKDAKARCQLLVPSNWTGETSLASAPGRKASAVVHGLRTGEAWEEAAGAAKTKLKPLAILEDGPGRLWYTYDSRSPGATAWYVAVPGDPVCTAEIEFREADLEGTARSIVDSLGSAR